MTHPIANLLSTHRRRWGLTQRELAALLRFETSDAVSRCERDLVAPNATVLIACQLVFGTDARDIFPDFAAAIEEAVVNEAYALASRVEGADDPSSKRKGELAQAILDRAVAHSKHSPTV